MPSAPPGPVCTAKLGQNWIDSGTMVLNRSEPPNSVGLDNHTSSKNFILPNDLPHRLLLAAENSLPYLAPELRTQIEPLLTLENFAILGAFIVADIALSGTGAGVIFNIFVGGLTIIFVGTQAIAGGKDLMRFYRLACAAKTADQFKTAGQEFAKAVSHIGIGTLTAILAKRAWTKTRGKITGSVSSSDAEASWRALADSINFDIAPNQGVIYAGISENEAIQAIANSKNAQGKIINQIAKEYGWTQERMNNDFGNKFSSTTYRLWEYLSLKYQNSLKGIVTAYVDSSKMRFDNAPLMNKIGAGPEVELTDGKKTPSVIITELEELITNNKNITTVKANDVKTGKSWIYSSSMKNQTTN